MTVCLVLCDPPRPTVLGACSLSLHDGGQVSHPTESARKGEDDSQVQTDPKESDSHTAHRLESPSRGTGSPQAKPQRTVPTGRGLVRKSPLTPPAWGDVAVMGQGPPPLKLLFHPWTRDALEWPLRPVLPSPPSALWGAVLRFSHFPDAVRKWSGGRGHAELPCPAAA